MAGRRSESGQGTVEYVGAVLLVAVLLSVVVALVGDRLPGVALGRTIVGKLICAVSGEGDCGDTEALASPLAAAYGAERAAAVIDHLPEIGFEGGEFMSLPVDFRRCRERACADTSVPGLVRRSHEGERPTVFTRVIDCRPESLTEGAECSGERAGNLYLQYWLYYPESLTEGTGWFPVKSGFHLDDWESYQVRIGADGSRSSRASSHNGYNDHRAKPGNLFSDAGVLNGARWGLYRGHLHVARGSHAGAPTYDADDVWRLPASATRMIPIEPNLESFRPHRFEVSPPWEKEVWNDPEAVGTGR